jgi:hypothetical protein
MGVPHESFHAETRSFGSPAAFSDLASFLFLKKEEEGERRGEEKKFYMLKRGYEPLDLITRSRFPNRSW